MVDREEKNLSPEEKLLKVIQSPPETVSADAKKSHKNASDFPITEVKKEPTVSVGESSSTQSVISPPPANVQSEQSSKPASTPTASKGHIADAKTPVIPAGSVTPTRIVLKPSVRFKSTSIAMLILLVIIIVSLGMTGHEIWVYGKSNKSMLETKEHGVLTGGEPVSTEESTSDFQMQVPYSIDQVTEAYSKRSPFAEQSMTTAVRTTQPIVDWIETARNSLRLIGVSSVPGDIIKAVLGNRTNDQIRIVRVGDEVLLDQKSVIVKQISNDYVILTDGKRDHTVK